MISLVRSNDRECSPGVLHIQYISLLRQRNGMAVLKFC